MCCALARVAGRAGVYPSPPAGIISTVSPPKLGDKGQTNVIERTRKPLKMHDFIETLSRS